MSETYHKIAFGGGCHWCTEAIFQSILGVGSVEQGFVNSTGSDTSYSEAVIVHFDHTVVSLKNLIEIHLHTHESTSNHSMRTRYRSAVYTFSNKQSKMGKAFLNEFQTLFENKLVTQVYPFNSFKASKKQFVNYYYSNPSKPFCKNHITPKLQVLMARFVKKVNIEYATILAK